ncbi:hypothetical protein [Rubrivivax gelatinosus]|uniref:hypothetical protein n=1 Tax=Rubrivivax gelatinosus TaxID=28068 RepID=UPI001A2A664F|nr:hypothetical protein [Rubrivivax gelatinosus]MBG6083190.1 hypothetical protein [Rubrivivax gelatinosus]
MAINVLLDSAESRRMPSGEPLPGTAAHLHAEAAEELQELLAGLGSAEAGLPGSRG